MNHTETAKVACLTDVLTRAGADVTLASVEKTLELRLNHGITASWLSHDFWPGGLGPCLEWLICGGMEESGNPIKLPLGMSLYHRLHLLGTARDSFILSLPHEVATNRFFQEI